MIEKRQILGTALHDSLARLPAQCGAAVNP